MKREFCCSCTGHTQNKKKPVVGYHNRLFRHFVVLLHSSGQTVVNFSNRWKRIITAMFWESPKNRSPARTLTLSPVRNRLLLSFSVHNINSKQKTEVVKPFWGFLLRSFFFGDVQQPLFVESKNKNIFGENKSLCNSFTCSRKMREAYFVKRSLYSVGKWPA